MGDSKINNYRDLLVWQKGIQLVKAIYQVTREFPQDERFGLTTQMRRAAVSIPSNIAEGQARRTTREFIHFVSNSEGSLAELDTQLVIAIELQYCAKATSENLFASITELRKMLNGLRKKLIEIQ